MKSKSNPWLKPTSTLLVLLLLIYVLPNTPIDPWNILNLKKIATLIFAIMFIQIIGSMMVRLLGLKAGTILTGFLGGLISSTATTAAIARESKVSPDDDSSTATLTFLSSTFAMLFECILLLQVGIAQSHPALFLIFVGPVLVTGILIFLLSRKMTRQHTKVESKAFEVLPILKLSGVIILILALSKIIQNQFGQSGLFILTFLASLFEIHGSVIANIQLHDAGALTIQSLGTLLVISIGASYLSKLILISTIGASALKSKVLKCTLALTVSLLLSWWLFSFWVG